MSESLCESTTSTKEDRMFSREYAEIDFLLSRDGFWVMVNQGIRYES